MTLSPEQEQEYQLAFLQHIVPGLETPRLARLYANAIAFLLPLLAHEVNPVDLLLLESIKFLYPKLHADIRKYPQIYAGEFGWDRSVLTDRDKTSHDHLSEILKQAGGTDIDRPRHLLTDLFPQLRQLFMSGKYGERDGERAQREQRVASLDYLRRYLTCSIPIGDISDQEVDSFLQQISALSDDEVAMRYQRLVRPDEERKLFIKLKGRVEYIPVESAAKLCVTIARHGSALTNAADAFARPIDLAGLLVRLLLQRLEPHRRKAVALDALASADPLWFAAICLGFMRPRRTEADGEDLFSLSETDELVHALAGRISEQASGTSLITGRPENVGRLLVIWQEGSGSPPVKEYVGKALVECPQASADFIRPFSSFPRTGIVGMDQVGYDFVLKFVEPEHLMAAFEEAGFLNPDRTDDVARMAQQFAGIYRSAKDAKQSDDIAGS